MLFASLHTALFDPLHSPSLLEEIFTPYIGPKVPSFCRRPIPYRDFNIYISSQPLPAAKRMSTTEPSTFIYIKMPLYILCRTMIPLSGFVSQMFPQPRFCDIIFPLALLIPMFRSMHEIRHYNTRH